VAVAELRTTGSGVPVTAIRIAINAREQPDRHDAVHWRQLAEFTTRYVTKGRLVYVEGRMRTRASDGADGRKRRTAEVVADLFQALSARRPAAEPA
jgi:single-strand DNA-binding protein